MLPTAIARILILIAAWATFESSPTIAASVSSSNRSISYVVVVSQGQAVFIAAESLKLELLDANDGRCPPDVTCVWAGHATVTLQVTKADGSAEKIVIGTFAPADFKLPFDATSAGYAFHLEALESRPDSNGKSVPHATVRISKP